MNGDLNLSKEFSMRINSNKIFFSVYQSGNSLEANKADHDKACEMLKREDIFYCVVSGVYKGTKELSFMLTSEYSREPDVNLYLALSTARLFNPESVLEVHNDGTAIIHSPDRNEWVQ